MELPRVRQMQITQNVLLQGDETDLRSNGAAIVASGNFKGGLGWTSMASYKPVLIAHTMTIYYTNTRKKLR
jgi:hypothetical protein